jgi:tetratricopeptide (TPR) repeat protein
MANRNEIETLIFYVLGDTSRQLFIRSGLEGVPEDKRVSALRGLQDLGWIGHGGFADFGESYSLTKEGRRIASEHPETKDFDPKVREHIEALRFVDGESNGARKDGLKRLITIECEHGNWDSALVNCFELRKLAGKSKDTESMAFSLFYQGQVEVSQNKWDEALESYLDAIEKFMELGDRKGVATTNKALGVIYGSKGDHSSAIRCFESSLSMARAINDAALAAKAEANLAIIFDLEGKFEDSEKASRGAFEYFLQAGDMSSASRIAINLGVLYISRERFMEADELFERTIENSRAMKNREVLGIALVDAGYCRARMGDTNRSLSVTDEAVGIFKETNNLNMLALAYRNYGTIELRNKNLRTAFDWFEKSVRAAKASGVEDTFAACCYEYGMGLISTFTNPRLAKKLLKKSSSVYMNIGNPERSREVDARLAAI